MCQSPSRSRVTRPWCSPMSPQGVSDRENTRGVLGLLRRLCQEREAALLVVTHDPEVAGYADRVHELRDGRLGERRSATEPLGVPKLP